MFKQTEKSFWQRADEKFGFVHDERTERTQLIGVRRAYYFAAVLFLTTAALQQFVNGQAGVLWVMGTAVCLSLIYLAVRRWQLGGTSPADERLDYLLNRSYRMAYIMLLLALGGYLTVLTFSGDRLAETNAIAGMFWWPPVIFLTIMPLFATHIQAKSYSTLTWRLVLVTGLLVVLIASIVGFLAGSHLGS